MALSGSFQNYVYNDFGIYCEWTATQSTTGNYSTIILKTYLSYYNLNVGQRTGNTSSIDGKESIFTTSSISDSSSGWKKKLLNTHTETVYHNTDGSKSCTLSASWYFNGSMGSTSYSWITASQSISLNKIDRASPAVTLTTSNITASSVNISATSSTTCDNWRYSTNNGSTWTTFDSSSGTSKSYVISGLSPNATYNLRVQARKVSNQVTGTSSTVSIKTLGGSILNSVNTVIADNSTVNITYNSTIYDSSYRHTLEIKNGSTTLLSFTNLVVTNGQNTITLTEQQKTSLLNAMSNTKSVSGTFSLITYSGSTQVGSASTKTANITTTETNSSPVFTDFTYADINSTTTTITGSNQSFIQGYSTLQITVTAATSKNGANISSYSVVAAERNVSSANTVIDVGTITVSGTVAVTVTAIDSRGYSASVTKNITVIEYEKISIVDCITRRRNEVENIIQVDLSGRISPIIINSINKNPFQKLYYRYTRTNLEDYSNTFELNATYTDRGFEFVSNEWISLDSDLSYYIEFQAYDKLSNDKVIVTISQGTPLVSFRQKKVGINNKNPTTALDVNGIIKMNNHNVHGFVKAISGEDFNEIIEPGIYFYVGSIVSDNIPIDEGGFLEVIAHLNVVLQRFTSFYNRNRMYVRSYATSWTAWTEK